MKKLSCVLLIDDDPTTNYLNQLLLRRLGVSEKVLVAGNGREALDHLRTHCPTPDAPTCPVLILLDINMPVMNGFEFLAAFAQLPAAQRRATVVVMLTTSLHPQDVERARQYDIGTFLSKPLSQEKLAQVLEKHF